MSLRRGTISHTMASDRTTRSTADKENSQGRFGFKGTKTLRKGATSVAMTRALNETNGNVLEESTPHKRKYQTVQEIMTASVEKRKNGSLISEISGLFNGEEIDRVLNAKVTARKFDYKSKIEQQAVVIRDVKECLKNVSQKRAEILSRIVEFQSDCEHEVNLKEEELEELRNKTDSLQAQMSTLNSTIELLEREKARLSMEAEALEKSHKEISDNLEKVKGSNASLIDEIDTLSNKQESLQSELADKEQQLKETTEAFDSQKRHLDSVTHERAMEMKRLEEQVELMRVERDELRSKNAQLETQVLNANEKTSTLAERVSTLEKEKSVIEIEGARKSAEAESLQCQLRDIQQRMDKKEEDLKASFQKIYHAQEQHSSALMELQEERNTLQKQVTELSIEKEKLENKVKESDTAVEQLRQQVAMEKEKTSGLAEEKSSLEMENGELMCNLEKLKREVEEAQETAEKAQMEHDKLIAKIETLTKDKESLVIKAENAAKSEQAASEKLSELTQKYESTVTELGLLKENFGTTDREQIDKLCRVQAEFHQLEVKYANVDQAARSREEEIAHLKARVEELMAHSLEAEAIRRRMHNQMQDLRGNIRVIGRIRPQLESDKFREGEKSPVSAIADNTEARIRLPGGAENTFSMDYVFGSKSAQQDVWTEVEHIVQSALDGYNVSLLAYGQTGSGKTYTMMGANGEDQRGIIPRALDKIISEAGRLSTQGWTYSLEASFVEIYNESIIDLLFDYDGEGAVPSSAKGNDTLGKSQANQIKHDPETGHAYVADLTRVQLPIVVSSNEGRETVRRAVASLMNAANKKRSIGKTDMNAQSSRSHAVFQLRISGTNEEADTVLGGSLFLVDLAGSERVNQSNATGSRLKEAQAINKSLSALGDVFSAIARKNSHIPFRNSKLTHLLQPCLSGNGKATMIINLSPAPTSAQETLCSLRFASVVSQCEFGKAKKNVLTKSDLDAPLQAPPSTVKKQLPKPRQSMARPGSARPLSASITGSQRTATAGAVKRPATGPTTPRTTKRLRT